MLSLYFHFSRELQRSEGTPFSSLIRNSAPCEDPPTPTISWKLGVLFAVIEGTIDPSRERWYRRQHNLKSRLTNVSNTSFLLSHKIVLTTAQPTWWPKNGTVFLYALTSSIINRFSKLFHTQNKEKTYNNTIIKDLTISPDSDSEII